MEQSIKFVIQYLPWYLKARFALQYLVKCSAVYGEMTPEI